MNAHNEALNPQQENINKGIFALFVNIIWRDLLNYPLFKKVLGNTKKLSLLSKKVEEDFTKQYQP